MKTKIPDYNNSVVQVPNSIMKHYGAKTHHLTLQLLDDVLDKNYKNVVIMVFDGLGKNILEQNLGEDSFLRKNMRTVISSVFPPTTTAALTALQSGLEPCEHGWLGWSCYFKEIDKCVDLYSNSDSYIKGGKPASPDHLAMKYMGYESMAGNIRNVTGDDVRLCEVSPFSVYKAMTCEEVCSHVENLCGQDGRKFIYAYHFQPDQSIHDKGCYSPEIKKMLNDFDMQLSATCAKLNDSVVIITADHGLTDIKRLCIDDFPEISQCLDKLISLESRCISFFIKTGYHEKFEKEFKEAFGDKFLLFTHKGFIDSHLLGTGKQHPKVDDFIGDYVAVSISEYALWYKNSEGEMKNYKGAHAGLSEDEMEVPLIIIENR
ncbi:MAG: alkaline phosphatase family protein [Saccharofermentanales bacterium]